MTESEKVTADTFDKLARLSAVATKLKKKPKRKKVTTLAGDDPCATERALRDAAYELFTTGTTLRDAASEALAAAEAALVVYEAQYQAAETALANCESP